MSNCESQEDVEFYKNWVYSLIKEKWEIQNKLDTIKSVMRESIEDVSV